MQHTTPSFLTMLMGRVFGKPERKSVYPVSPRTNAYIHTPGRPVWMGRDYARFADEAYIKNVIAHRAIGTISQGAASVSWKLFRSGAARLEHIKQHPLIDLLLSPNPVQSAGEFFESLYAYRLISGNAYILSVGPKSAAPRELHLLRPDRIAVIAGEGLLPQGYRHSVGDRYTDYNVDRLSGRSRVLHLKNFHPLNDWYGLSPIEAAAYSIDQHNQAGAWNQSMLQNGARPSGALVVTENDRGGNLSEEQYTRLKAQVDEQFSGPANAGRPLLLEGGLDWREMSLTPKDMDFINAKHSSARDIALAFGVPPQLLGIPGDNTYSNLAEARLALWEQTIMPLVQNVTDALNQWLCPLFGNGLSLVLDNDSVSALSPRREAAWARVQNADFLTEDEKRAAVGYGPKS